MLSPFCHTYIHTYYYFIVQWQKLPLPTTERAIKNAMQCPPFPLIHLEYYPVPNPKIPSTLSRQQQRWVSNSFPSPSYTECCDVWGWRRPRKIGQNSATRDKKKEKRKMLEKEESQHASSSSSSLGTSSLGSSTTTSWGLPLSCLDGGGGCCKQLGDGVGDKTPKGVNLHDTLCPPQVISLGPVSRGGTGVF